MESSGRTGAKGGGNLVVAAALWFARELSAPIAAVPAWGGLLSLHLRKQPGARLEWGNHNATHQRGRGGDCAGPLPAGGERTTIGRALRTLEHWCPPRR